MRAAWSSLECPGPDATQVAAAALFAPDPGGGEHTGSGATRVSRGGGLGAAQGAPRAGLLLVSAPRPMSIGAFFELSGAEVTVGRSPDATIRVEDPGLSRLHLRISRRPDGVYVAQDLGSTNGTFVKGVSVRSVPLVEGDRIQLGTATEFLFGARSEAAEEEIRLRQAVGAAGAGTWEWKAASGEISFAGGLARALGREPETTEPLAGDDWAYVHEDDRAPLRERLAAAVARGGAFDAECRLVGARGGLWVAMAGEAFRDESGATLRIAGTALDVTERKRAELELRRQSLLFDSISDAVVVVGLDGSILDWNAGAERTFGWSRAQALGRRPGALLDLAGDDRLTEAFVACGRGGGRVAEERTLRSRGGADVLCDVVAVPLRGDEPAALGCVVVLRDIGERRRLEARLQVTERLASLGTLAAGVAHEINNPLSYVASNLDYVASKLGELADVLGPHYPALEAALADSRTGAGRIREIVTNLTTFAGRGGAGKGKVDPNAALEFALRVADSAVRHRARLVRELLPVPPVVGGEGALGQVFLNLLVNAAQAIPPGRASTSTITVRSRFDAARQRVVVEIADTGSGIAPEHLDHIFEPFFTTKPVGSGTGLGLFVCHGIVSALGGQIEVESAAGHGSTFRVSLPAVEGEPDSAGAPSLLVIDDEPLLGASLQRAFEGRFRVEAVTDPRAALDRIRAGERFDLVLVDLVMPDMTGREFMERLAEIAPAQARSAAFTTGGPVDEEARRFTDEARAPLLEKPLELQRLADLVERGARRSGDRPQ
jgi:PAS domain S-box-containing protein